MAARGPILRICIGFLICWLALDRSAAWLGSYRGEFGLAVCAVTLAALLAVEWALFRSRPAQALGALGLGRPDWRGPATAAGLCLLLLLFYPAYALITGTAIGLRPDGWLLAAGLFAQGGVAEESLFRGYLFRRFREGRGFWSAAWLSLIPFVAVHLLLLATLDWPLALASIRRLDLLVRPPLRTGRPHHLGAGPGSFHGPGFHQAGRRARRRAGRAGRRLDGGDGAGPLAGLRHPAPTRARLLNPLQGGHN